MEPNTATIISGLLSMAGGFAGALGAYFVATYQTKKQFKKQDNDRVLELRVEKLNDALTVANDYLHQVQKAKGKLHSIDIYIKDSIQKGYNVLGENHIVSREIIDNLIMETKEFAAYKDSLKKYKIFTPSTVKYQEIYDATSNTIESCKPYFGEFRSFPNSLNLDKLRVGYDELILNRDKEHNQLETTLNNTIDLLEKEIQFLLKI